MLLFPTAVMIMLLVAAMVLDTAHVSLRSRSLEAVAASAANDAVAALDIAALRAGSGVIIDPAGARVVVHDAVAAGPLPEARVESVSVGQDPTGRPTISVTLELDHELLLSPRGTSLGRMTLRRTEQAVVVVP